MSKQMQIIINPVGETKLETTGFSGASCQDATRDFERRLGVTSDESLTSEYYTEASSEQNTVNE